VAIAQAAVTVVCTYSIAPTSQAVTDAGGGGSVAVTASASSCQWTATSNAPWIAITSGATSSGSQQVAYAVSQNTGAARSGTLTIAGQTFTVDQAAAPPPPPPCSFSIAPPTATVAGTAGTVTVTVTATAPACAWTASSPVDWITIASQAGGQGTGSIDFAVAANPGTDNRTATLTVAGQPFTVTQGGADHGGSM